MSRTAITLKFKVYLTSLDMQGEMWLVFKRWRHWNRSLGSSSQTLLSVEISDSRKYVCVRRLVSRRNKFWAEKLLTAINLPSLMPAEDHNFGGSLVLDFRKWWRHVQPKNRLNKRNIFPRRKVQNDQWLFRFQNSPAFCVWIFENGVDFGPKHFRLPAGRPLRCSKGEGGLRHGG